jgi:hypothetical protein
MRRSPPWWLEPLLWLLALTMLAVLVCGALL